MSDDNISDGEIESDILTDLPSQVRQRSGDFTIELTDERGSSSSVSFASSIYQFPNHPPPAPPSNANDKFNNQISRQSINTKAIPIKDWKVVAPFQEDIQRKHQWVFATEINKKMKVDLNNIPVYAQQWHSTPSLHVTNQLIACPWGKNGQDLAVFNMNEPKNITNECAVIKPNHNNKPILDFNFLQTHEDYSLIGSVCDNYVDIWNVSIDGLQENHMTQPYQSLKYDGNYKFHSLINHPRSDTLLCTTDSNFNIILWDIEQGKEIIKLDSLSDIIYSTNWSSGGSLLGTTCRDKIIRLFDPRASKTSISQIEGHTSLKCSVLNWLDGSLMRDSFTFFTVGYSKTSDREIAIWDRRYLKGCLALNTIDTGKRGPPMVFYDEETSMIVLADKRDSMIKFFDVSEYRDSISYLNTYKCSTSVNGMCLGNNNLENDNTPYKSASISPELPFLYTLTNSQVKCIRLARSDILNQALIARKLRFRTESAIARETVRKRNNIIAQSDRLLAFDWYNSRGTNTTTTLQTLTEHRQEEDEEEVKTVQPRERQKALHLYNIDTDKPIISEEEELKKQKMLKEENFKFKLNECIESFISLINDKDNTEQFKNYINTPNNDIDPFIKTINNFKTKDQISPENVKWNEMEGALKLQMKQNDKYQKKILNYQTKLQELIQENKKAKEQLEKYKKRHEESPKPIYSPKRQRPKSPTPTARPKSHFAFVADEAPMIPKLSPYLSFRQLHEWIYINCLDSL